MLSVCTVLSVHCVEFALCTDSAFLLLYFCRISFADPGDFVKIRRRTKLNFERLKNPIQTNEKSLRLCKTIYFTNQNSGPNFYVFNLRGIIRNTSL